MCQKLPASEPLGWREEGKTEEEREGKKGVMDRSDSRERDAGVVMSEREINRHEDGNTKRESSCRKLTRFHKVLR